MPVVAATSAATSDREQRDIGLQCVTSTGWRIRESVRHSGAMTDSPRVARSATAVGIGAARERLAAAERIMVLTGAGISTDSGIPDFRGPNGLWTKNPAAEKTSSLQHYLNDVEVRQAAWQNRLTTPAWTAEPNSGHRAIVELEHRGQLLAVVTQNIDGLHQKAGNDADRVIEVHGTVWFTRCWECDDRRPMFEALDRVRGGDGDPSCLACGGILKSDTISFGQALVPAVIDRALQASESCDLLLAVGSSLSVFPAANCVPRAKAAGAQVIIVNGQPTAMDRYADSVIVGQIGEVLPALIAER
jgi:NAD-dependent deacetylase